MDLSILYRGLIRKTTVNKGEHPNLLGHFRTPVLYCLDTSSKFRQTREGVGERAQCSNRCWALGLERGLWDEVWVERRILPSHVDSVCDNSDCKMCWPWDVASIVG